jgi:hypothetical protein
MKKDDITIVLTPYQARVVELAINEMSDLRSDRRLLMASVRIMLKISAAQRLK